MTDYNDTTACPAFTGATAKQEILRAIETEIGPNCPNIMALLFRINNSDLSALTDGATVYIPTDGFASS